MNRKYSLLGAAVVTLLCPAVLAAQEGTGAGGNGGAGAPIVTLEAGFSFTGYDPAAEYDGVNQLWLADGSDRWYSSESARVGLTARYGNRLVLDAELNAPFNRTDAPVSADEALRELSIKWDAGDSVVLTAGKQNLKWGTARVFSSVDSLSPALDPLDPGQTDRGVTGLRFDIIPTWWFSLAGVALPSSVLDRSTVGLRAEILAGETDLSFGVVRATDSAGTETPTVFADFARFFDRWGIYGEAQAKSGGGLENIADEGPAALDLSATTGLQVDFPAWLNGTVTFLGEWRWREDSPGYPDSLNDEAAHSLYAGLSGIPLTRRVTLRGYALAVPKAEHIVCGGEISWSPEQALTAYIGGQYLAADADAGEMFVPYLTAQRYKLNAGVTVWY